MLICARCDAELEPDAELCLSCGEHIGGSPTARYTSDMAPPVAQRPREPTAELIPCAACGALTCELVCEHCGAASRPHA